MPKKITEKEVQDWIRENHPQYKMLKWGGKAKSISNFLDKKRNIEFECAFSVFKNRLAQKPNTVFKATKKEIQKQRVQTLLKNYGVENPAKNKKIYKKIKQTNLKKYGGHPLQNEEIKKKTKKTNLQKYGVEHSSQSNKIKEKIRQSKTKKELMSVIDGKSLLEWKENPELGCHSTLLIAHKNGIHPLDVKTKKYQTEIKVYNF